MKTFLVLFIILYSAVVDINSKGIEEEMNKAFDICLEEYQISEDELESSSESSALDCFDSCVFLKAGIVEDKKFNMKKYADYLRATEDPEDATELINIYKYCVERMLDTEDECESILQLEKCVDEKLDDDYKKN